MMKMCSVARRCEVIVIALKGENEIPLHLLLSAIKSVIDSENLSSSAIIQITVQYTPVQKFLDEAHKLAC